MAEDRVRAPFDYPDWDVALRSSDKVVFRLHKSILSKASPVFEDMFALPTVTDALEQPQVVDMAEQSDAIERLLRIIYPVPSPTITTVAELASLLEALKKFQMEQFIHPLELQMMGLFQNATLEPLRAYSLAYLYKMRRVAQAAARHLLLTPQSLEPASMPPEYAEIPASAIWALGEYRRSCTYRANDALDDMEWLLTVQCPGRAQPRSSAITSWAWTTCTDFSHPGSQLEVWLRGRKASVRVSDWWYTYNATAKEALRSCPSGEVVMHSNVILPAAKKAATCSQCSPEAWQDLLEYSQLLAKRIDERTSSVQIKLPF